MYVRKSLIKETQSQKASSYDKMAGKLIEDSELQDITL